jgi:hypothetical protein
MAERWSGPALIGLGLLAAAVLAGLPALADSAFAYWILTSALSPAWVMPLVGFGVALALAGWRTRTAAFLLFAVGMAAGFLAKQQILAVELDIPTEYLSLTSPVSALAVGLALAAGARVRPLLLPAAALIVGVMQAIAIELSDFTVDDPAIPLSGMLVTAWIVVAVWLTLRAFRQDWFIIGSRILGSWLLAIGVLYGGALLAPIRTAPPPPPPPPPATPASPRTAPNVEPLFPDAGRPGGGPGLGLSPDEFGRFKQP